MKVCILMGSMNRNGNTAAILEPLKEQFEVQGVDYEYIWLKDYKLEECKSCFACQNIERIPGCSINDEMKEVYEFVLESDCILFASPIYTWFCTASLKIVMDRLFCMNKFYGSTETHYSLMKDKKYAAVATCGNKLENGVDLFGKSIDRLAKHSGIEYIGMLAARDVNGISDFKTDEVIWKSKEFAKKIYDKLNRECCE